VPQRWACRVLSQPLSTQRYKPSIRENESLLIRSILELVAEFPRFGGFLASGVSSLQGFPRFRGFLASGIDESRVFSQRWLARQREANLSTLASGWLEIAGK
jgi:hypothetical protein